MVQSFQTEFNHFSELPRICVLKVRSRDDPEGPSNLTVVMERIEEVRHGESQEDGLFVHSAEIRIEYVVIDDNLKSRPRQGYFLGKYHCLSGVSLTGGAVYLDLRNDSEGLRIGSLLMNEIVQWAKQWPEAAVIPIQLLEGHAKTEHEKIRRNKFYENFKIQFDYDDPPKNTSGRSKQMLAGDLRTNFSWRKNISVHSVLDTLLNLQTLNQQLEIDLKEVKVGRQYYKEQLAVLEKKSFIRPILNFLRK